MLMFLFHQDINVGGYLRRRVFSQVCHRVAGLSARWFLFFIQTDSNGVETAAALFVGQYKETEGNRLCC